jgi:glutathione synthase
MNICFLMYPWESIEAETDTTLRIIHEAFLRNHKVAICTPSNLTIRNSITSSFCKFIEYSEKAITTNIPQFHKRVKLREKLTPLAAFDVIFMRANPPLDTTMLNFLDSIKEHCFIINDIEGLRKANNKLYPVGFNDTKNEFIPATYVSKNKEYLKKVIHESPKEKMILKPLNGYGGRGVIVIERSATQNINSLLDFYIDNKANDESNYVILQEYVEGAEHGDIRVLMLNGEPIGAMRRVPASDDIRSNVHAGGSVAKHTLSKEELKICKKIGKKLVADGLYFVGIDIINGKLIEVNVCSPGGITRINKLNRVKLQEKVMDFVEEVVKTKESAEARKKESKKEIEED